MKFDEKSNQVRDTQQGKQGHNASDASSVRKGTLSYYVIISPLPDWDICAGKTRAKNQHEKKKKKKK